MPKTRISRRALLSGAGVVVALPAVQTEFGVDRSAASLPYTLTMLGLGAGGILMGRATDRFGVVWGQRLREQFNRAARNSGWAIELRWSRLHTCAGGETPTGEQALATLRAVSKRFGVGGEDADGSR